ncbi:hypothetical protein HF086_014037 [Spodoptera exigua]|uniref:Uncharacterized protein n=1 Tax=Spodoptera exigua TaxID=7107 RepID=A0A922MTT4_SPOEX|nr:hypothetical protein HF086_014037 [Spodoptera exigua]
MSIALYFVLVAAAACASANVLPINDFCITISTGQPVGYSVSLPKAVMPPGHLDWDIEIPDIRNCPTVLGVVALVCDGDTQPEAHFVNPKLIRVHRVYGLTNAYIQATVYCQNIVSSKLNLEHQLSPHHHHHHHNLDSTLAFPQSLLSNSLTLSPLVDSPKSLWGRPLQSVSNQRQAHAVPLSAGLNRLSPSKLSVTPLFGKSEQSIFDLSDQSSQSNYPKLTATPLLG